MHWYYNLLATSIEISFIGELLNLKSITNAVYFHCYDKYSIVDVHKNLNKYNIRASTVSINDECPEYISKYIYSKSAIIIDAACGGWSTVLDSNAISFQNYSLVFITGNLSSTVNILVKYPIQVDSDVIVAENKKSVIKLYEIYNTGFHYDGIFKVINIGFWNSSFSLKQHDRKNLDGLNIKIASIILPTAELKNETVEQFMERARTKFDTVHRMKFFILLKYMRDMYNISYDVHRTTSWGYKRNGTFDGMVGALFNGMADIGAAPCFFRRDRAEKVNYISEVWMSRHSFIFRHPRHPGGFYTIYTRPLSGVVWFCTIALIVVTAIVTWIMLKMQDNRSMGQDASLSLAGLAIWGAVCQQNMFIRQETTSVKLAIFVIFVYALTVNQYYNATLVSSLLMEEPRNIKTLKDLLESDLRVGADDIAYNMDYFKRTTDPVAIELYRKKVHTSTQYNFYKSEEGMALVKKGGFALHVDTAIAFPIIRETFNEREICETQLVQMYPLQKCGVVIRRNSPYKEHITYGIRKMYEAGLLHRIKSVIDVSMPECAHTLDLSVFSVSIREFSMPLVILGFGIVLSWVIFIGEVLVNKVFEKKMFVPFKN